MQAKKRAYEKYTSITGALGNQEGGMPWLRLEVGGGHE